MYRSKYIPIAILCLIGIVLAQTAIAEPIDRSQTPIFTQQDIQLSATPLNERPPATGPAALSDPIIYSAMDLGEPLAGCIAYKVKVEDYVSVADPGTYDLLRFKFVGGVSESLGVVYFDFYDDAHSFVGSFGVEFPMDGNWIWAITGLGIIAEVPHQGFVEAVADTEGAIGPPTNMTWIFSGPGPTVGFTNFVPGGENCDYLDYASKAYAFELDVNVAPVAMCQNVVVSADENCEAYVGADMVDAGSYDPNGDAVILTLEPPGPYPALVPTDVALIATDPYGLADTCMATITVIDDTPPEVTLTLTPDMLWPPNHKMAEISAVVTATDNCSDPSDIMVYLVSITSNEPDNGSGDGNTEDDIVIVDDLTFYLRAERSGEGMGRVYTVTYVVVDGSGNTEVVTGTVTVPHDRSSMAMAGLGVDPETHAFTGPTYTLIIPSTSGLDARAVDLSRTFVGNNLGRLAPISRGLVDATGNGMKDLMLTFNTAETTRLLGPSIEIQGSSGRIVKIDKKAAPTPVAFRYVDPNGVGYLAEDILALPGLRESDEDEPIEDIRGVELSPRGDLRVNMPAQGFVQVDVFSVLGRRVRTLVSRELSPGSHDFAWNGTDFGGNRVANGVYFYRIQLPDQTLVRKIHLVH